MKKARLSLRLALWMFIAAAILQGAYLGYLLSVKIADAEHHGLEHLQKLVKSLEPTLSEVMYNYNQPLGNRTLNRFEVHQPVQMAWLQDEKGIIIATWGRTHLAIPDKDDLHWNLHYKGQQVGQLQLKVDFQPAIDEAISEWAELARASLLIAGLNLIVLFTVAQRLVARPISRLSELVTAIDTTNFSDSDVSQLKEVNAVDEVALMRDSISNIFIALADNMEEKKRALIMLKRLVSSLEDKVSERTQEYLEARQEAERANNAKTEFLNTMTHELRTPLNAIIGFSSILKKQELADRIKMMVDNIQESSQNLLTLVNDIIDYVDLEGKALNMTPFAVVDVLTFAAESFKSEMHEKGLSFFSDFQNDLIIKGDNKRLATAVRHLIGNAVKFTQSGEIHLNAQLKGDRLEIEIRDTGPGMDLNKLDVYLSVFKQGEGGLARSNEGTGLGLAIVQRICKKWGGNLVFEQNTPCGTVVRLSLPTGKEINSQE